MTQAESHCCIRRENEVSYKYHYKTEKERYV